MNWKWLCVFFVVGYVNLKQIYKCDQTLSEGVCTRQMPNNLVLLKQCSDQVKKFCPLLMDGKDDDLCESPDNALNRYPGETCIATTECISQKCIQEGNRKICGSKSSSGSSCTEDSDCDVKFSCIYSQNSNTGICASQLNLGDKNCGFSKYDQKCLNGLVCNLNACIEPFSIDIGGQANNSMACKSYYNYYYQDKQQFLCTYGNFLSGFKNDSELIKCINSCSYSLNYSGKMISLPEMPCDFSYSDNDISYCNPGRAQLEDQIAILKDYLNNSNISNKCHISTGFFCDFYDSNQNANFYKAYIAFVKLTKYNQVYNSSDCINNTINEKYTYALKKLNSGFRIRFDLNLFLSFLFLILLF